jgi:glutathione S-transferase
MHTLYYTPLSPGCRKVRLMLKEKNIPFQLKLEDVWQRRMEFFALNPGGEVPVLLVEKVISPIVGTYAICEYLDEKFPDVQFFGNSPEERAEVRRLVEWFDVKFEREVMNLIVFEKVYKRLMGYGEPSSEAIRVGGKNMLYHLDYLAHLLSGRNWIGGEYLTLADITAAAHLSCLDYLGAVSWDYQPQVKEWYMLIKSRPSFRDLLEDKVHGFKPPEHYNDLDF